MSIHVDVTWWGCPICHGIWPDNRECCEVTEQHPPGTEDLEYREIKGATLTYYSDLPDDNPGGFHEGITRFSCDLADLDAIEVKDHVIHRCAWRVEFDDAQVNPMNVCHQCARELFGVEP